MALNDLLLSILLNANPLDDSLSLANADTAYTDLTGDKREERIEFCRSYTDSSFCKVFGYDTDSTYKSLLLIMIKLDTILDYRLFIGDYNQDGVSDFTIALPNSDFEAYITWDKKKKEFVTVFEPLFYDPYDDIVEADSTGKED